MKAREVFSIKDPFEEGVAVWTERSAAAEFRRVRDRVAHFVSWFGFSLLCWFKFKEVALTGLIDTWVVGRWRDAGLNETMGLCEVPRVEQSDEWKATKGPLDKRKATKIFPVATV